MQARRYIPFLFTIIIALSACQQNNTHKKIQDNEVVSEVNGAGNNTNDTSKSVANGPVDEKKVRVLIEKGTVMADVKKYNRALTFFDSAIMLDPKNTFAYTNRAAAYFAMGQPEKSMADCNTAYSLNNGNYYALYTRAMIYLAYGNYKNVISDLTRVIQLDSAHAEAYTYRGVAEASTGDIEKARMDFNKSIKINPKLPKAYYNRGLFYGLLKKTDSELRDYKKALKIDPNYTEARYNLAVTEEKDLHNYKDAITEFDKILKVNPQDSRAIFNRGKSKQALKNYNGALEDYNAAIQLNPTYKSVYLQRSELYKVTGDKANAMKDLATANSLK